MKLKLFNKGIIKERIKDLGIGTAFVGIGILLAVLMIAWLLYNIFIFSKG